MDFRRASTKDLNALLSLARRFDARSGFAELDSIWMIKDLPD